MVYICFWSLSNGLTQATVLPVIRYLLDNKLVSRIILFTPESRTDAPNAPIHEGLEWRPIFSGRQGFTYSGFQLLIKMVWEISRFFQKNASSVDLIWARASTAGGAAALLSRYFNIPFGVESFEPHSDYMIESGAWKRGGIKHKIQRWLERMQRRNARTLITVSEQYKEFLESSQACSAKLLCIPCTVDFEQFKYDAQKRKEIRSSWGITEEALIGAYVGKLGDIYYDHEFFEYLKPLFSDIPKFHLVVLSPAKSQMRKRFEEHGLDPSRISLLSVPHAKIAAYLSASDFGFCPVRTTPSKRFCSPVKTGEYLANGLPVLIAEGIGDDSQFIHDNGCGLIVNFMQRADIGAIKALAASSNRTKIAALARPFRSTRIRFKAYQSFFNAPQIPK